MRWTEKRNFEAILNAIAKGTLKVKPLITERVALSNFQEIYGDMGNSKAIASILEYDTKEAPSSTVQIVEKAFSGKKGVVGIVGAGNFTSSTILPNLKKLNADIKYIASSGGLSSTIMAKRHKIANSTSDYTQILGDSEVDLVLITTKHNLHAPMVVESLKAGKSVFVEKPLALNANELQGILHEYEKSDLAISVGFNRRFSPLAKKMKALLGSGNTPINITATMNAGFIPSDVWVHDMEVGGGRIIGEACHYIDLCTYFAGSKVIAVCMNALGKNPSENTDNASILLRYENGSNAVINYFSNGSKTYSKERVEVYSQERTMVMDNWRKLKCYGFGSGQNVSTKQDKGHYNQFKELLSQQINGGSAIIPFDELVNTTKTSFAAIDSLKQGKWISIN